MADIIDFCRARQAARPQPKGGIGDFYFTGMSPSRQVQRILKMRAAGMPHWFVARLVRR